MTNGTVDWAEPNGETLTKLPDLFRELGCLPGEHNVQINRKDHTDVRAMMASGTRD